MTGSQASLFATGAAISPCTMRDNMHAEVASGPADLVPPPVRSTSAAVRAMPSDTSSIEAPYSLVNKSSTSSIVPPSGGHGLCKIKRGNPALCKRERSPLCGFGVGVDETVCAPLTVGFVFQRIAHVSVPSTKHQHTYRHTDVQTDTHTHINTLTSTHTQTHVITHANLSDTKRAHSVRCNLRT